MFKRITASLFTRRATPQTDRDGQGLTRSELQDLFRNDLEVQNRSAVENTGRTAARRPQTCAA